MRGSGLGASRMGLHHKIEAGARKDGSVSAQARYPDRHTPGFSDSRINQYEHGKHEPDYRTVQRLSQVLQVPSAYFYAENDLLADLIQRFDPLSDTVKRRVLRVLGGQIGTARQPGSQ